MSSNPDTEIGYYGSIVTMICYPCPDPCSNCNIDIASSNSGDELGCDDDLCTNGLVCTDCLLGNALVAGQCIHENNCRAYSYYQPTDTSTAWSSDNCVCLDGYSMSSSAYA